MPNVLLLVTVRAIVAVCVTPPPLAVTVRLLVPAVAVLLAAKARADFPPLGVVMLVGLNVAVTPEGSPDTERESAELKPPLTVVAMVLLPEPPCATERLAGEAVTAKSGFAVAVTLSAMVVV